LNFGDNSQDEVTSEFGARLGEQVILIKGQLDDQITKNYISGRIQSGQ
jgi:hypothetical protein